MTTISEDARLVTFINVFMVSPDNQQRLIDLLTQATDLSVRHANGFVSAALHQSLDGTQVTMYAQWQSMEAYQAMRGDLAAAPYLAEALTISTFEPGAYNVARTFVPPAVSR